MQPRSVEGLFFVRLWKAPPYPQQFHTAVGKHHRLLPVSAACFHVHVGNRADSIRNSQQFLFQELQSPAIPSITSGSPEALTHSLPVHLSNGLPHGFLNVKDLQITGRHCYLVSTLQPPQATPPVGIRFQGGL